MGQSNEFDEDLIKGSPQSRRWIFTIFDVETDFKKIWDINKDEFIQYLYTGLETAPTTGRKHFQGFIQFKRSYRRKKVQDILQNKCWCNPMRGNFKSNLEYCSKEKLRDTWFEFGEWTSQGKRNDLKVIKEMIDKGSNMFEVAQEHFGDYIRYYRGFEKYKGMIDKNNSGARRNIEVNLIYGKSGVGKTAHVLDLHGDENVFIMSFSNKTEWWDGYEGEKIILFDDYNNNLRIDRFLRLLDRYKCRLPVKCGFTWAKWDKVYITTNLTLTEIHSNSKDEHRNALFRRIHKVWTFHEDFIILLGNGTKCGGNIDTTTSDLDEDLNNIDTELD